MPHLFKSRSPTDPSTPTPHAKLVKDFASRRDSRALAATSTAIALSIGSAFYDTRETSGDDAAIRGKDTGWKAAYGAARMAVKISKESSGMFPPLKAVVGAVSVLIKNYDVSVSCSRTENLVGFTCFPLQQTSDNMEGVKEIERRVQSLSGVLASPVSENDCAEKARRMELRRYGPVRTCIGLLIPLSGSWRWLSRSSNRSPTNVRLSGSYITSMTPKHWPGLSKN